MCWLTGCRYKPNIQSNFSCLSTTFTIHVAFVTLYAWPWNLDIQLFLRPVARELITVQNRPITWKICPQGWRPSSLPFHHPTARGRPRRGRYYLQRYALRRPHTNVLFCNGPNEPQAECTDYIRSCVTSTRTIFVETMRESLPSPPVRVAVLGRLDPKPYWVPRYLD